MKLTRFLFVHSEIFVLLFLISTIFTLYWQVLGFPFTYMDDPTYVIKNTHVQKGISLDSIAWAFSFKHGENLNWHPLTWISHMLDYQLFGLNPGMHHISNVFYHTLNTILLFLSLRWMTNSVWKSAFVAALFALHPVNVDSVVWIAERKNLLSTTFWMLTIISYFYYTRKPNTISYLLIIFTFCLGMLAKTMLMTLPFVLLLLDYWPLGRLKPPRSGKDNQQWASFFHDAARLFIEKIPLIILTLTFIYATMLSLKYSAQISANQNFPMHLKIQNAIVSYLIYMGKMVWPKDLCIFYPFPEFIPLWKPIVSIVALLFITAMALLKSRKYPYLIVGWLWFLGALVPVLGIIQAGLWPAIGERWAYVPYIGLFVIIAWGIPDLFSHIPQKKIIFTGAVIVVLTLLTLRTLFQIGYWKDDVTLFSHCIKINPDNNVAQTNLGNIYAFQGKSEEAFHHFHEALRIHPNDVFALDGLARLYNKMGQYDKSIQFYKEEIGYHPKDVNLYFNSNFDLGTVYAAKGDLEKAIKQFSYVISLNPDYALAYYNLGIISVQRQDMSKATEYFSLALKLNNEDKDSHCSLGAVLMKQGRIDDAINQFNEALRIDPHFKEARNYLASAGLIKKKVDENIVKLEQDKVREPNNPDVLQKLAVLYAKKGENSKALDNLKRLVEIQPANPNGYYNIACVYAKEGNVNLSIEWLKKSLDKGFKDWNLLKTDKDLDNIRTSHFYKDLIQKISDK